MEFLTIQTCSKRIRKKHLKPVSESRKKVLENLQNMVGLANVKETVDIIRNRMIGGYQSDPGHYVFYRKPRYRENDGSPLLWPDFAKPWYVKAWSCGGIYSHRFDERGI